MSEGKLACVHTLSCHSTPWFNRLQIYQMTMNVHYWPTSEGKHPTLSRWGHRWSAHRYLMGPGPNSSANFSFPLSPGVQYLQAWLGFCSGFHVSSTTSGPYSEQLFLIKTWELQRLTAWVLQSEKTQMEVPTWLLFYLLPLDHMLHPLLWYS